LSMYIYVYIMYNNALFLIIISIIISAYYCFVKTLFNSY